jgi:hypothetical protein
MNKIIRPDDGWYGRNNCRLATSLIHFLVNSCVRHNFIRTIICMCCFNAQNHCSETDGPHLQDTHVLLNTEAVNCTHWIQALLISVHFTALIRHVCKTCF